MSFWRTILDPIFAGQLEEETRHYLEELKTGPKRAAREQTSKLLRQRLGEPGAKVRLGQTTWGEPVEIPLEELVKAHSLISGATGSGKTRAVLILVRALLLSNRKIGWGVVDAKRETYLGALFLIKQRLDFLDRHNPVEADALRRRIKIYDFSSRDPISAYNLLSRWPGAEPEFFALSRADLILDLLEGGDRLSLSGTAVLQKFLQLLPEFDLPITYLDRAITDEQFRRRLLERCQTQSVSDYFARAFASVQRSTLEAIRRRIEALFASEGVRMSLAGRTAPDFRRSQDEGDIVLINTFGETIPRSVSRLLQGLVLSDIRNSIFARRRPDRPFLWICDEAQNFFLTAKLRENMNDILTMSRSFGSYFLYATQNMTTAVQDKRMLQILYTNLRWSFAMRGAPSDAEFLRSALPVTGRKVRPNLDPFAETRFYPEREERSLALEEIARLPDRVGYLWLKSRAAEAFQVKTADLVIPEGRALEEATAELRDDPRFGERLSRREHEALVAERERQWTEQEDEDFEARLTEVYQRQRGGGQ